MKPIEAITKEELAKKDEDIDKLIIAFADKHPNDNGSVYIDSKYANDKNPEFIKVCPCCKRSSNTTRYNGFSVVENAGLNIAKQLLIW